MRVLAHAGIYFNVFMLGAWVGAAVHTDKLGTGIVASIIGLVASIVLLRMVRA
jgi:hypothetical protein